MERAEEVASCLKISSDLARALLIKSGWDTQKVITAVLEDEEYIKRTFVFEVNADAMEVEKT